MLFQRVESEGLSHYSYLVGDGNAAVVIDPRRDCEVYVELAADAGLAITHVLETHRNEDYAIGSDATRFGQTPGSHVQSGHQHVVGNRAKGNA